MKIAWTKFSESKGKLGNELTETLLEIITDHGHIEFETKD